MKLALLSNQQHKLHFFLTFFLNAYLTMYKHLFENGYINPFTKGLKTHSAAITLQGCWHMKHRWILDFSEPYMCFYSSRYFGVNRWVPFNQLPLAKCYYCLCAGSLALSTWFSTWQPSGNLWGWKDEDRSKVPEIVPWMALRLVPDSRGSLIKK